MPLKHQVTSSGFDGSGGVVWGKNVGKLYSMNGLSAYFLKSA